MCVPMKNFLLLRVVGLQIKGRHILVSRFNIINIRVNHSFLKKSMQYIGNLIVRLNSLKTTQQYLLSAHRDQTQWFCNFQDIKEVDNIYIRSLQSIVENFLNNLKINTVFYWNHVKYFNIWLHSETQIVLRWWVQFITLFLISCRPNLQLIFSV